MALPAIMRTTAARLSALYVVLFSVCALILVLYMTSMSERMLTAQTQSTINEEMASLGRAYQRGGLPTLVRLVSIRSRQPGANLYLIADRNGDILAGNVQNLNPSILGNEGWTEVPFAYQSFAENGEAAQQTAADTTSPRDAIALVLRLPNSMTVMVGRDLGEPKRFRTVVQRALMVSLGTMVLAAFLIWLVVGRRALRRIDELSGASRRIIGGDLAQRLPVAGTGDEFDRLSESLNAMIVRIAQLNEGLKQVSDNIAHDLKTPLTRLRNRAEAALADDASPEARREALESTIQGSEQLIRTFNSILMISRLEAGQTTVEPFVPVDLAASVLDVIDLYEPVAEEAGVTLSSMVEAAVSVSGNRELIGQALANLIDNAIKYSRAGEDRKAEVSVSVRTQGEDVVIEVADNGPGIPDAIDRERAKERFVRLDKSRSLPGSGLGLSIARAVMLFHGGRLDLQANDPGLRAVMVFPKPKEAA